MSSLLLLSSPTGPALRPQTRTGVVRGYGQVCQDDTGVFSPLGLTFFPLLYMWKYERERVYEHFNWLKPKGFDYIRALGEVDWDDRTIDPNWPDYTQVMQEATDYVYDECGIRVEWTIVGGRQYDKNDGHRRFVPAELAQKVCEAMRGREHKVMHLEMANEWDRLDKVSMTDLKDMAEIALGISPNLIALSRPKEKQGEHDDSGYGAMKEATAAAGANCFTLHLRRSDADYGWSHVRQGYDLKDFPSVASNNEPEGPQSSVESMDNPLQLACARLVGVICGGAPYVLHVGQGVTCQADPNHGRPENMWEVPNIDEIMRVVRQVDALIPEGVENWKVVNNARDDHPLPLDPHAGFWEGSDGNAPACNKNYGALSGGADFCVMLTGCRSVEEVGPVPAGTAIRACHVDAYDPVSLQCVVSADLQAGQSWSVPGRHDTMAGYLVRGTFR